MTGSVWYPIRVTSQKEHVADLLLKEAGVNVWFPYVHKWRRYSVKDKRRRLVQAPLLPRYLFVSFDGPAQWWRIFQFNVARTVWGAGDTIFPISDASMALLHGLVEADRARCARHADKLEKFELPKIEPGDFVRHPAISEEFKPRVERIRGRTAYLLLSKPLMGRDRVETPIASLEVA